MNTRSKQGDLPALASVFPSGLMAIVVTASVWPRNNRTHAPRCTSHRRHVLSILPVARYNELGWNLTHCHISINSSWAEIQSLPPQPLTLTSDKCPVYILNGAVLSELHNRAVRSRDAVAKYTPIGPHSTSHTGSLPCPLYTTRFEYVSIDHSRTVPSCEEDNSADGRSAEPYTGSKESE